MTAVHYFQRYAQQENVDTNNTLLLLSQINAESPRLLGDVLEALFLDDNVKPEVGVQFFQQTRAAGGSVPDATVFQPSFRLVVEAKRNSTYSEQQLARHLSAFRDESQKVLLLLTPQRHSVSLPGAAEARVHVISRTYADLIGACREAQLYANTRLREIVEDYELYCQDSNLLSTEAERMLVVPVGTTLHDNIELGLYYAPASRRFQPRAFIGLYSGKRVRAIGRIENVVAADSEQGQLTLHGEQGAVSPEQEHRIRQAIAVAPKHGYDISRGHRFYLVDEFCVTEFMKASPGGLFGRRYFNLRDELGLQPGVPMPAARQIAERLRGRSWE